VFKSKALLVVAILVIALAVIASSCAPAAPAAPAATPAAPAAPAAAPAATPATPSTPAATSAAPAAPVTHSWGDSATYTNDAVGFTVQYPAKWQSETPGDPVTVFQAAKDTTDQTGDRIYVDVIPAVTDLSTVGGTLLNASAAFQQYKVTAKAVSAAPFTLTSGSVTAANAQEYSAKIVIYNFYFYAISATKGSQTVNVMGGTIGGGNAKKQLQEICQSLSFK
jgi:FlaG/FlaF family flagellin (archaellin)